MVAIYALPRRLPGPVGPKPLAQDSLSRNKTHIPASERAVASLAPTILGCSLTSSRKTLEKGSHWGWKGLPTYQEGSATKLAPELGKWVRGFENLGSTPKSQFPSLHNGAC